MSLTLTGKASNICDKIKLTVKIAKAVNFKNYNIRTSTINVEQF